MLLFESFEEEKRKKCERNRMNEFGNDTDE